MRKEINVEITRGISPAVTRPILSAHVMIIAQHMGSYEAIDCSFPFVQQLERKKNAEKFFYKTHEDFILNFDQSL